MELSKLIASIVRQEEALAFEHFNEDAAWMLGSLLRNQAIAERWPVVIDIRLFHRPLFFTALPGSSPDNAEWARRKCNVVQRFSKSSYRVGREMALKNDTLAARYGLPLAEFADHGGGFPLKVRGCGVIGAIIVSGLPQEMDHMLVVRSLCKIMNVESNLLELA